MGRSANLRRAGATLLVAGLCLQASASLAYERGERGDLRFIVGWGEPPAFAGERNSVQIVLIDGDGPVTSGVDLEVEITRGEESLKLPLAPQFEPGVWGQPGDYRAFFVPTEPGAYTFRITGEVEGRTFRERFDTGQGIEEVVEPGSVSLPADDTPSPTPSPERGLAREVRDLQDAVDRLESATSRSLTEAADARGLAVAALVYGLLALLGGLAVAGFTLLRRRRARTGTTFWER